MQVELLVFFLMAEIKVNPSEICLWNTKLFLGYGFLLFKTECIASF